MIGGFFQRISNFLTGTENINIILAVVAIVLVVSLATPEVIPEADLGARCTNLPNPAGGNRQSLLAQGSQRLGLSLNIVQEAREGNQIFVTAGAPILLRVTFDNNDNGPITLFWTEGAVSVGNIETLPPGIFGLVIEIEPEAQPNTFLSDPVGFPLSFQNPNAPAPQYTYELENLYLLRGNGRCFVDVRISTEQQQRIGLGVGEYSIRVFYQNLDAGTYIPPTPNAPDPTATPMFDDLNVWAGGRVQSNRLILTVQ
jgi:hypothetical protein